MEGLEDFSGSLLYESDEHLLAAAQNVVKLLGSHRYSSDRLKKLLADVDFELLSMKLLIDDESKEFSEIRERLKSAKEKIKAWISDQTMTWDSSPDLFAEYLESVDEMRRLSEQARDSESDDVLQAAMTRIEEELRDVFAHSLQDKDSAISEKSSITDSADLIPLDSIPVIKSIARVMFSADYDKEFCDAFVSCQKEALDELLTDLEFKRFTIEELIKMDWRTLDGKIKTWIHALEIFIQVHLDGEKWLCHQIFEDLAPMMVPTIFAEITSPIMLCFLNFGHGVAMGARKPEKIFNLINIYDVITKLAPTIRELFNEEEANARTSIKTEVEELVARVGCVTKATFLEFGDFVLSDPSLEPFPAGKIHHLTKYVMNYINTLTSYKNNLNTLLCIQGGSEEPDLDDLEGLINCLMAFHLRLIVDKLETNLETKAELYKDVSLRHVFLLNNFHYIVQKVKYSDLRAYLGDDRIRKLIASYKTHYQCYLRSSWIWTMPLLKDEGGPGFGSSKKTVLKEKARSFASAFEEVYKVQTGWCIKDDQLKQELRISIQKEVISAYRSFVRRCKNENLERHVKYEADYLEELLQDLFEGSLKSLNGWRR